MSRARTCGRAMLMLGLLQACEADLAPELPIEALSALDAGERYLGSRATRRAVLEASLVNPENSYSLRRLNAYGLAEQGEPTGWDALPLWNPPDTVSQSCSEGSARRARAGCARPGVNIASEQASWVPTELCNCCAPSAQ